MLCFYATDMSFKSSVQSWFCEPRLACTGKYTSNLKEAEVFPWSTWLSSWDEGTSVYDLLLLSHSICVSEAQVRGGSPGRTVPPSPSHSAALAPWSKLTLTPLPTLPTAGFSLYLSVLNTHPRERTATTFLLLEDVSQWLYKLPKKWRTICD